MSDHSTAAPTAPIVRVARVIGASVADACKAWTDAAATAKWWGATEKATVRDCKMDVRVGGAYRFVKRAAGSEQDEVTNGLFVEVNPPHKLVFSWTCESLPDVTETRVSVNFVDMKDNTCRVVVIHEGVKSPVVRAALQAGWYNRVQDLALHFVS